MGFTMNSLQIETVTPDKAREYLGYNYAHNRPLKQAWINHLANEMTEGRFLPTAEIHIMYCNGEPVLVNGQHTCSAIALYGKPIRATVRKSSTTEHGQVAMMYAFGHDNGPKRNIHDAVTAYNVGEVLGIGPTRVKELTAALRHIRAGFQGEGLAAWRARSLGAPPVTEIVEHMYFWAQYAKMLWAETASSDNRIKTLVSKRGFLPVAMITYCYQPAKAGEFWRDILRPDSIAWNDPRAIARRVIEDSVAKPGAGGVTPSMQSRQIARCWRGFINGETMAQKPKQIDESAAIVIVGTPYNGRQPAPPWWPDED